MRTAAELLQAMTAKNNECRAKLAELDKVPLIPKTDHEKREFERLTKEVDALGAEYDVLAAEHRGMQASYGSGARAHGGEREKRRTAVEEAILHRSNPRKYKLPAEAREFAQSSLVELARDTMEAEGVSTRGLSRPEIAQRSLMSTSDFPLTLANVTNRSLRDSYQASPRTFQAFCKQTTLSDFKVAHRVKVGDLPQLLPVQEDGEFKRGSMSEGDEQIKLSTFGRVVGITRQVILNDDLGAFTKLPQQFGISAANLESNIMWGLIMSNPVLFTDNTAIFHVKHNNLKTGPSSALIQTTGTGATAVTAPTAAAIAAARISMAKQVGDGDGANPLNLAPFALAVPPELEIAVQQILFGITPNQTGSVVPDSIRSMKAIVEPRLSTGINGVGGSATGWYAFADPDQIDTFEYAYLDGQDGPYTETRNGWEIDGMEVKCRHDFGAAAIDFRGAVYSEGA